MNANLVFSPRGELAARYDKMHLFAYDNGRERYDEARTLQAGRTPVAFDADGLRVGLSVCYDLRFPELYRALARPPCDLLSVPSAFTYTTGAAHWEVLLRARAIENQCYVVAAAQGGTHENGRRTFGHSLVIDPWGEVVACRRDDGEGVVIAELAPRAHRRRAASAARARAPARLLMARGARRGDRAGARLVRRRRRDTTATPAMVRANACRGPARMVDFGSDGRIGAKWNAATRTIAYGRPQKDGHYHAFIADADGGRERRVAFRHGATIATSSLLHGIPPASCLRCWSRRTSTSAARSTRSPATARTPTTGS